MLSGGSYCENGGMPYCKSCYGSKHGPKVYGFGAPGSADGIKLDVTGGSVAAKSENKPASAPAEPAKAASSTTSTTNEDPLVQLEKLAGLRDKGIITDAEFQAKKRQLLGL